MVFAIRSSVPADLPALYRICLLTGHAGADATARHRDPELLGHYYAAPYAVLEPDLCFVLTAEGEPCGYVLGTHDTAAFNERAEREWFPALRARLPRPAESDTSPDADLLRLIHAGYSIHPDLVEYPAHLHIDLLPAAQGRGLGRKLIECFFAALRGRGVPAVHLGVSEANTGAIAFYEKLGFQCLGRYPGWRAYGLKL
jgi:ribosomal protein S18 acetylase RimI-like enzyme